MARGRVYFVSSDGLYAIGPKKTSGKPWKPVTQTMEPGQGAPAWVQVEPTELVLKPGQTVQLHARLFDAQGRFLKEDSSAAWSLAGLKGTVTDGKFTVAPDKIGQVTAEWLNQLASNKSDSVIKDESGNLTDLQDEVFWRSGQGGTPMDATDVHAASSAAFPGCVAR